MTHINYARLFLMMLLLTAFTQAPLLAQIATHRLGAPVSLQSSGQNTSVGFVQRYVLTNAAGIIQYTANTLPFTGVAAGQYKAYSVNYDQAQTAPTLTVGTAINAIGGACVNTSAALPIGILDCNNTTGNITPSIAGQNSGASFTQKYILTDSIGKILQITNTPQYLGLSNGIYNVYAVNYETATGITGLTVGQNKGGITGTCVNISQPLGYVVCRSSVEIAGNGIDDDGDGLIDCHDSDVAACTCTTTSSITFGVSGQNTTAGFTTKYVLTDSFGVIKQIVNTPSVSGLTDGKYRIYSVNYETATGITGLTIGQNISAVTGTCVAKSLPLLYKICLPPSIEIAGNGIDDDGDNLIDCHDPDVAACTCTTTSSITFGISGQNTTSGFTTKYVLTDSFGIIKQIVNTPSVSGLTDGKYRIYSVNYETATGITGLTVGQNISAVTGTCVAKSLPLLYKICLPNCPPAPTASVTAQPTCSIATGTITVTAPTETGMTYSIDGSTYTNTTGIFTGVAAGTYSVTAKNSSGCTSASTSVTVNAQPATLTTPTASVTAQPTCSVATGTITITAPTGTGMTYSIDGSTYTNTTGIFTGVAAGTYSVTAKNSSGCTSASTSVTVNAQPATPATPTASVTAQPTCSVATGTITITAPTGAGMTYSIDGSTYTNTTGIFTGVAAGTYNVTAKNSVGCISSSTSITVNGAVGGPVTPTASVTAQPTCAVATGTITITAPIGTGLTYSIDGSTYTNTTGIFTSVAAGTYNVTAKNSIGCTSSAASLTVNAQPATPSVPTASVTAQPTCLVATGTITVTAPTGTGMTYSIDGSTYTNTTGIFTGIAAGTYSVTAKNSSGCTSTSTSVTVNAQPATPSVPTASVTAQPTCLVATGTITVTAPTGTGMTYSIDGSTYTNTTGIFTGVAAGTYSVTAKNSSGCTSTSTSVTVNAQPVTPSVPTASVTTQPTCPIPTGTITVTAPTGTGMTYSIDGSTYTNTTGVFTGVAAGTYSVTAKNSSGCISASTSVTVNAAPVCGEICNNSIDDDSDGKIDCEDSDCTPCNCTTISNITYTAPSTNPTANHTRRYVLTNENGVIQKVSLTPIFLSCPDGQYRVYTVWYVAATYTPPLSIGSNISTVTGTDVVVSLPKLEKVCSPTVQYETRILQKDYDCLNKKLTIQVQVRAKPNTGTFLMGDANYRFDYNSTQLKNPSIISQEHFSNVAPASDLNYIPQSLNGSSEGPTIGTVSLNTVYGGGGLAARTVDSMWQTVSCIQFDKQDTALCYSFRWHDNLENPSTGMTGLVLNGGGAYDTYDVKSGGYYGNMQNCLSTLTCCPTLDIKVMLEGPYNATTGLMNTTLNQRGLLPNQTPIGVFAIPTPIGQPYNTNPWSYAGTESIVNYPATVVDWVLVSLRTDSTTAASTLLRKAGLLHNDGRVTFIDSCWNLTVGQKYFVVVEHRNHMGVMSKVGFIAQSNTLIDFTAGDGYIRTNPPTTGQKQIGSKWCMLAGDGRKELQVTNFDINFNDQQRWKTESGIFDQYRYSDFNLDADTNFLDSNMWKKNNGRYSGVPH